MEATRWRRTVAKLWQKRLRLVGFGVVVGLLLLASAEAVCRIANVAPYTDWQIFRRSAYFPYFLHEWRPGHSSSFLGTDLAINRAGFIGREYELAKPDGVVRTVLLGDSIAAGWKLDATDDIVSSVLEKRLSSRIPSEVLNLAVPGYDAFESVVRLRRLGLQYAPDVVVYVFCLNDLREARIPEAQFTNGWKNPPSRLALSRYLPEVRRRVLNEGPAFQPEGPAAQVARRQRSFERYADLIRQNVHGSELPTIDDRQLLRLMDQHEEAVEQEAAHHGSTSPWMPWIFDFHTDARVRYFKLALSELARLSQEGHFKVVVVFTPLLKEGDPEVDRVVSRSASILKHLAETRGFTFLDVTEPFRAAGLEALQVTFPGDDTDTIHPNARGHELMAAAISDAMGMSH